MWRFGVISLRCLPRTGPSGDHDRMDLSVTIAMVVIGLGAVSAGAVGIALPPGERIAAALPLIAGAGVGVIVLAIGAQIVNGDPSKMNTVFLIAALLGFSATEIGLAFLWRRSGRPTTG